MDSISLTNFSTLTLYTCICVLHCQRLQIICLTCVGLANAKVSLQLWLIVVGWPAQCKKISSSEEWADMLCSHITIRADQHKYDAYTHAHKHTQTRFQQKFSSVVTRRCLLSALSTVVKRTRVSTIGDRAFPAHCLIPGCGTPYRITHVGAVTDCFQ